MVYHRLSRCLDVWEASIDDIHPGLTQIHDDTLVDLLPQVRSEDLDQGNLQGGDLASEAAQGISSTTIIRIIVIITMIILQSCMGFESRPLCHTQTLCTVARPK